MHSKRVLIYFVFGAQMLFAGCQQPSAKAKPLQQSPSVLTNYDTLKAEILQTRSSFYQLYAKADEREKSKLIDSAQQYLLSIIVNKIFPQWYNTPWEFYGATQTPRHGTIACGYFVTTVLHDAGLNIPRINWAQQASEVMIKRMTTTVKRFSNIEVTEFEKYFADKTDGLYVVGLDNHVGFIYKLNGKLQFVHSSYYHPSTGVMSENLNGYNPLANSKYRVLGKILERDMIVKWILNEKYN
jgi:hypothetical protein